jgi:hypothetical protein
VVFVFVLGHVFIKFSSLARRGVCLTPLLKVVFAQKKARPNPPKAKTEKPSLSMSGSQARRAHESRLLKAIALAGFISVTAGHKKAVEFDSKYNRFIVPSLVNFQVL